MNEYFGAYNAGRQRTMRVVCEEDEKHDPDQECCAASWEDYDPDDPMYDADVCDDVSNDDRVEDQPAQEEDQENSTAAGRIQDEFVWSRVVDSPAIPMGIERCEIQTDLTCNESARAVEQESRTSSLTVLGVSPEFAQALNQYINRNRASAFVGREQNTSC
jgi:hypothetical protein